MRAGMSKVAYTAPRLRVGRARRAREHHFRAGMRGKIQRRLNDLYALGRNAHAASAQLLEQNRQPFILFRAFHEDILSENNSLSIVIINYIILLIFKLIIFTTT